MIETHEKYLSCFGYFHKMKEKSQKANESHLCHFPFYNIPRAHDQWHRNFFENW